MYVVDHLGVGGILEGLPVHLQDLVPDLQVVLIGRRTWKGKKKWVKEGLSNRKDGNDRQMFAKGSNI